MAETVRPTRMELLNTKQKVILAEKGHKILKQKRDALVLEFFNIVKKASDLRTKLDKQTLTAHKALAIARAFHGEAFVETQVLAAVQAPRVAISTKNVMGLKIPAISSPEFPTAKNYSVYGTSAKFDEAVYTFRECLKLALQLAETETALKRLLVEIEKTNRRVNALEYNVTPNLKATIKMIAAHLSRLESEQFFALKVTKRRLQRAAEQAEAQEQVN